MTDEKLNAIEAALAHQEQQIQDMSELISRQWKEIETLKKRLEMTNDKLGELENSKSTGPVSEKPPHY